MPANLQSENDGRRPKVLVSDKLSQTALSIFRDRGIDVDFRPELGRDKDSLLQVIGEYDGLAIRSATKVSGKLLEGADRLKVVGRAGIGVDNIDVPAASRKGVIVMNTPLGNAITTAEHAIAMMMSMARQIPEANASIRAGNWEKSRFVGTELFGKTLGVVGCGNIGSAVCRRAIGLEMRVVCYDPFLSEERATRLGVDKVDFDELLSRADIITFHVPLTDRTRRIMDASAFAKTKKGVRIVNCARGGVVDEAALVDSIRSGHVAGAALDVFESEPPVGNPLLELPEVVVTPHLGASTTEAQEKVAQQIAEQMSDYLLGGAVNNALNMPSISAEEAPRLLPWVALADHLGSFVGQMTDGPIASVSLLYDGAVANMNVKALNAAALAGILRPSNPDVNMVSAEMAAKDRGFVMSATTRSQSGIFEAYISLTVVTDAGERSIVGTVFSDGKPRFIQIKGIYIDAEVSRYMLYTTNKDVPGIIGALGTTLGDDGVNIANFNLGRSGTGRDAIALLTLDSPVDRQMTEKIKGTGFFNRVRPLEFNIEQ